MLFLKAENLTKQIVFVSKSKMAEKSTTVKTCLKWLVEHSETKDRCFMTAQLPL